jgi:hypothetical protein
MTIVFSFYINWVKIWIISPFAGPINKRLYFWLLSPRMRTACFRIQWLYIWRKMCFLILPTNIKSILRISLLHCTSSFFNFLNLWYLLLAPQMADNWLFLTGWLSLWKWQWSTAHFLSGLTAVCIFPWFWGLTFEEITP